MSQSTRAAVEAIRELTGLAPEWEPVQRAWRLKLSYGWLTTNSLRALLLQALDDIGVEPQPNSPLYTLLANDVPRAKAILVARSLSPKLRPWP